MFDFRKGQFENLECGKKYGYRNASKDYISIRRERYFKKGNKVLCQDFRLFEGFTVRFRSCQNVSVCSNLIFWEKKEKKCTVNSVQTSLQNIFPFFQKKIKLLHTVRRHF